MLKNTLFPPPRISAGLVFILPRLANALDLDNLITVSELDFHSKIKTGKSDKGVMTIEVSYQLYHLLHKIFPILNNVKHCQCLVNVKHIFSVQHKFECHLQQTTIETEKFFNIIILFVWKIPLNTLLARNTGSYIQIHSCCSSKFSFPR